MKVAFMPFSTPEAVAALEAAGHEVRLYEGPLLAAGCPAERVLAAAGDAEALIAGLEPYDEATLARLPRLKLISRCGIGYDAIDTAACRRLGIGVVRTLGAIEGAVAEHVMAGILYYARRLHEHNANMHARAWKPLRMEGAKTRTLGLVGFGGIGKEIALRARPFGMRIVYTCRHPDPAWQEQYGAEYLPMDELLAASDYVSVNVPLTEATRGMFDDAAIAKMKKGAVLINIARGPVVPQDAAARALESGHLAGVMTDVYDAEPCTDSPLADCPQALLTPHCAGITVENVGQMMLAAAGNLIGYFDGTVPAARVVVDARRNPGEPQENKP